MESVDVERFKKDVLDGASLDDLAVKYRKNIYFVINTLASLNLSDGEVALRVYNINIALRRTLTSQSIYLSEQIEYHNLCAKKAEIAFDRLEIQIKELDLSIKLL